MATQAPDRPTAERRYSGGAVPLTATAGIAVFQGAVWARTVAVILAGFSIVAGFVWMPYYPLWSMVVIAFDVFVIWALTAHGRDITQP